KEDPESGEYALVRTIKRKLGQDPELVAELEKLTAAGVKEQTPSPGQFDVEQRIRLIQGPVVGAAIGTEVVNGIYAKVKQVVDTVEAGGSLTGVKIDTFGATGSTLSHRPNKSKRKASPGKTSALDLKESPAAPPNSDTSVSVGNVSGGQVIGTQVN